MANHSDSQVPRQEIFKNVQAGGNITTGNITQTYHTVNNLGKLPKPTGFPQNIPTSGTNTFVGRERELERVHQHLQSNHSVVVAAVKGMGGVGKTELAIQYALLHLQFGNYPGGICWLRAGESDVEVQILQFAKTDLDLHPPENLELSERVRWCWQHWRQGNTLIVLDDVKNYSHIKPYLPPQKSQFKVLITTRLKLDLASSLFLEVLSETEALLLLAQLIGEENQHRELALAKELCQRLGYLPLALQLVGRYVNKRNVTLAELLRRLSEKGLNHPSLVVEENDPTWTLNVKHGVAAAFELSWEELNDDAKQLGCVLSLFALAPIPWPLVERAVSEQDAEELENARVELRNLHLLQGEDTYELHQLIREFFKNKQNNLDISERQKDNFCTVMVSQLVNLPQTPTLAEVYRLASFIPHIIEVVTVYKDKLTDRDLISPFLGLGYFYRGQGAYSQALPWVKQCVLVARERLGEEHLAVAISYSNLAVLYTHQGQYSEAEPLYQKALSIRQRLLGEEHPHVATSYNNLAALYADQGRYSKAEPLYQKALSIRQRVLGEEHPYVATSYNNLAALYADQGRYSKAEPLYQKALSIRQRVLGEEHPDVASSHNNLGELYRSQGRYSEAEPLYQKALSIRQRALGEEHPDVATSYNSLAVLYYSQGQYSEAEPLYQKALSIRQRLLGEEHPHVATSYNNLAALYADQGRYSKAEPLYQKALSIRQRVLGEEHPDVASSHNNLGELYRSQGRYSEAEPLYQKALSIRQRALGEEHPDVANSYNNLGELYRSQGRYSEAIPLYRKAWAITKSTLGINHPNTTTVQKNIELLLDDVLTLLKVKKENLSEGQPAKEKRMTGYPAKSDSIFS
jgi:tetratricopeptide (TPR) repeat protein